MRLAGHTYAYRARPFAEALDELQAIGFTEVEVWIGHVQGAPSDALLELRGRDLRVAALSAGGFYERGTSDAQRAFALAEELGAPTVVACVAPELLEEIQATTSSGVQLCVENHWDQPLATPRSVRRALRGRADLAACLDTGHAILASVPPDRFAVALGGSLGHIHLKDARMPRFAERLLGRRVRRRFLRRPPPVMPGRGDLDLSRLAAVLARNEYQGSVSVEYEGPEPRPALQLLLEGWLAAWRNEATTCAGRSKSD